MSEPAVLELGDGARHRLFTTPTHRGPLEALGLADPERASDALLRSTRVRGGRGPHHLIALPGTDGVLRLRPARRGGLLAGFLSERFLSADRIERELRLWLALAEVGVPLPTAVAALARRHGLFWSCHFVTIERPIARDGLAWLRAAPARPALDAAARSLGHGLRRLHDRGVLHGDLHLANLLIEGEDRQTRCAFIDLDHARPSAPTPAERMAELARLARSLEKHGLEDAVPPRVRAGVVSAYCGGDAVLRRALRASRRRERRRLARHRLGWWIAARWTKPGARGVQGLACLVAAIAGSPIA